MKIALAQQNYHIGNFESNSGKIIDTIRKAKNDGVDLVVFSELCICGYPPRDFLDFNDFIEECYAAVNRVAEEADGIAVLIGSPARNPVVEGKDLFNAAFLLYDKKVQAEVHKTLLPNYDIFDEYRYFEPADKWQVIPFKGYRLAITICEDIWNMGDNPLYRITPMEELIKQDPDIMINLSASPYNYAQDLVRNSLVRAHTIKYKMPMFYCNTVGSQTEVVFDGGSLVYDANGERVAEMKYFEEDYQVFDLDQVVCKPEDGFIPEEKPVYFSAREVGAGDDTIAYMTGLKNIEEIHQALILGIRDYFGKMGFDKAILGASGGIDSAVTQALAVEALGLDKVRAILMPSHFSTSHSVSDAELLSKNLGNPYDILPIKNIYDTFLRELEPIFAGTPFGIAEENIQSRTRGNLLMAIANKFGYILLNTSNKSELATGYGTLYGDMAGGLGVLGDLYKMQVYALARYINREREIIPNNIIDKAPSAELRPEQKDSDSLPDYNLLDRVLFEYIEMQQGPREIINKGYDPALVKRILKMVNNNEYKRNQFCPIIRVSFKAFGVGRRVPIVGKYLA